jgi:hypothetical protein
VLLPCFEAALQVDELNEPLYGKLIAIHIRTGSTAAVPL